MKKCLIPLIALALLVGCKKELKTNGPVSAGTVQSSGSLNAAREGDPIILTGDVLDFKTQEDFDAKVQELEQAQTELNMPGFTSLFRLFNNIVEQEDVAMDIFTGQYATMEEAIEHASNYQHTTIYTDNSDIIKQKTFSDNEPYEDMDIYSMTIAKLVNKYGFVIIDDVLYRFTENNIYSTPNWNPSQTTFDLSNTINNGQLDVSTPVMTGNNGVASSCDCYNDFVHSQDVSLPGNNPKRKHSFEVRFIQKNTGMAKLGPCVNQSQMLLTGKAYKWHVFKGKYELEQVSTMQFQGQFHGTRPPVWLTGQSGFSKPNPFTPSQATFYDVMAVTFTHFIDFNRTFSQSNYEPCFSVAHANYKMATTFGSQLYGWTQVGW